MKAQKNDIETIADLSLIAVIYLHKQEPSGWDYAIKAYNKAKDIRHKPSIYITAANMANYLCNNRDFQGAITHIKEAFEIADILRYDTERTYLNTFLGSVYESTGQSSLAEGYYKVAMKISEGTTPSDIAYAGIKYAIFLKSNGRYQEALDITKMWNQSRTDFISQHFRHSCIRSCRNVMKPWEIIGWPLIINESIWMSTGV